MPSASTTNLAPVLTGCHVCRDPKVEVINGWMKARVADLEIERRLKEAGTPYSRQTLGKHRREHLMTPFDQQRQAAQRQMEQQQRTIKGPKTADLAVLIRDQVAEQVQQGILAPSIGEGLRAQEMLDRRAEKGADRDLMLQLAQVLGGATTYLIEGEYREVDEEAEATAEEIRLLTSGV